MRSRGVVMYFVLVGWRENRVAGVNRHVTSYANHKVGQPWWAPAIRCSVMFAIMRA